ncbi:MAG: DUF5698 domain-containing protein [Anaerolineales bacterium]|jgi:uncharacterized protein YebE (UPF0316 family)|nr:DUF5698 domain-containing protein [Anaerolineales bacterium]
MFEVFLSPAAWLAAFSIFGLRVVDMSLDTLRLLFVVRGHKAVAWILGFFQAGVFVIAITSVLSNINNPLNIIGYSAGFATGNVIGMLVEERLAVGHVHMSIISPRLGVALSEILRESGYGVTEISARGKDGMVSMLSVSVLRKDVARVQKIVYEKDPDAFVTAEDVRPLRRGFWRA